MLKIYYMPRNGQSGSAAVYSLLEHVFSAEYGESFPAIKKTPIGKPYFPDRPDVHFSLSHTMTHVLCAIADNPVGADIESPRRLSERAVRYFCSPEELSHFDPLDLWVLKESHIKLIGGTLSLVKSLQFSRENGKIITPDKSSSSKLYRIGDCRAALSAFCTDLPDSAIGILP